MRKYCLLLTVNFEERNMDMTVFVLANVDFTTIMFYILKSLYLEG